MNTGNTPLDPVKNLKDAIEEVFKFLNTTPIQSKDAKESDRSEIKESPARDMYKFFSFLLPQNVEGSDSPKEKVEFFIDETLAKNRKVNADLLSLCRKVKDAFFKDPKNPVFIEAICRARDKAKSFTPELADSKKTEVIDSYKVALQQLPDNELLKNGYGSIHGDLLTLKGMLSKELTRTHILNPSELSGAETQFDGLLNMRALAVSILEQIDITFNAAEATKRVLLQQTKLRILRVVLQIDTRKEIAAQFGLVWSTLVAQKNNNKFYSVEEIHQSFIVLVQQLNVSNQYPDIRGLRPSDSKETVNSSDSGSNQIDRRNKLIKAFDRAIDTTNYPLAKQLHDQIQSLLGYSIGKRITDFSFIILFKTLTSLFQLSLIPPLKSNTVSQGISLTQQQKEIIEGLLRLLIDASNTNLGCLNTPEFTPRLEVIAEILIKYYHLGKTDPEKRVCLTYFARFIRCTNDINSGAGFKITDARLRDNLRKWFPVLKDNSKFPEDNFFTAGLWEIVDDLDEKLEMKEPKVQQRLALPMPADYVEDKPEDLSEADNADLDEYQIAVDRADKTFKELLDALEKEEKERNDKRERNQRRARQRKNKAGLQTRAKEGNDDELDAKAESELEVEEKQYEKDYNAADEALIEGEFAAAVQLYKKCAEGARAAEDHQMVILSAVKLIEQEIKQGRQHVSQAQTLIANNQDPAKIFVAIEEYYNHVATSAATTLDYCATHLSRKAERDSVPEMKRSDKSSLSAKKDASADASRQLQEITQHQEHLAVSADAISEYASENLEDDQLDEIDESIVHLKEMVDSLKKELTGIQNWLEEVELAFTDLSEKLRQRNDMEMKEQGFNPRARFNYTCVQKEASKRKIKASNVPIQLILLQQKPGANTITAFYRYQGEFRWRPVGENSEPYVLEQAQRLWQEYTPEKGKNPNFIKEVVLVFCASRKTQLAVYCKKTLEKVGRFTQNIKTIETTVLSISQKATDLALGTVENVKLLTEGDSAKPPAVVVEKTQHTAAVLAPPVAQVVPASTERSTADKADFKEAKTNAKDEKADFAEQTANKNSGLEPVKSSISLPVLGFTPSVSPKNWENIAPSPQTPTPSVSAAPKAKTSDSKLNPKAAAYVPPADLAAAVTNSGNNSGVGKINPAQNRMG